MLIIYIFFIDVDSVKRPQRLLTLLKIQSHILMLIVLNLSVTSTFPEPVLSV